MPMQDTALRRSLDLLRSRRFGTFWFASLLSNVGTWAQHVAQPWLLLSLGASSVLIGLDAFAMSAPVWLLTLVGGVLADRADRRRVAWGPADRPVRGATRGTPRIVRYRGSHGGGHHRRFTRMASFTAPHTLNMVELACANGGDRRLSDRVALSEAMENGK
jgi:hypothetical protein